MVFPDPFYWLLGSGEGVRDKDPGGGTWQWHLETCHWQLKVPPGTGRSGAQSQGPSPPSPDRPEAPHNCRRPGHVLFELFVVT